MIRRYQRYRVGRRWLVVLAMLGCVAFHAALIGRLLLSPEQFRARTRLLLQRQFGGEVEVGEAAYEFPAGFRLRDLCIHRPAERGGGELFRTKALAVDLGFLALLRGKVSVDDLVLDAPEASITAADLAEMRQRKPAEARAALARVIIRGGRIVIGKGVLFPDSPERELSDVNLQLTEQRRFTSGYDFEGEAKSALWGRCILEGALDLGGCRADAKATASRIPIDERLREAVPEQYRNYTKVLDSYALKGMADLTVESSVAWAEAPAFTVRAVVDLRDCSAAWERFPVRVTDIRGKVVFDGTNIYYQDIAGRAGRATVTLSGRTTKEKIEAHLVARDRPLDREVYEAAPPNAKMDKPNFKGLWDRLGIEGGIINVDHQSTFWRADKRFEASVRSDVRDVRATYKAFPYPLTDVFGSIRWENGVSYLEGLRGRQGRARVQIRGQVTDAGVPDLTIEASDVPFDDVLYKALSPGWKKTYEELRPEGTAAVLCSVTSPDGSKDKFQYRLVIRPEGASFQHKDFAHRITDVRGDILVDEAGTVSFRELKGRLGAIPLNFLGTVRPGEKGPCLDLTVVAPEVELSPAVKAYLPKEWAGVYDDLDPRGKVSFTWRLATDPATGAARRSSEVACVQDCSVQHKLFPLRITSLMGRFTVDETGSTTFTGMKGRIGTAAVDAVAGHCAPGGVGGLSFTLRAAGLQLDEEVRRAIPASWQKVWDEVRPAGEAVVEFQFTGNPQKPDQPSQKVTVEPTDGSFCYRRLPLPVSDVTRGKVTFHQDGTATISNLQGKVRGKAVQLGGKVAAGPEGNVLHLDVTADELDLDDELRRALPPEWQETWDSFRPSGKAAATVAGVVNVQKGEWQSFRLDSTLRGVEATWRDLPVRLTALRGRLEYADGVTDLTDVVGGCAIAEQVRLSGRIAKKGTGTGRVQVAVQNAHIVPELLAAFPAEVRKALEAMELKGAADIEMTFAGSGKPDGATNCFGLVRLRDASFRHSYAFEQVSGSVRMDKAAVHPDGTQNIEGGLDLRKAVVRGFTLTEIKGSLAYTRGTEAPPTKAGEKEPPKSRLVLSNLAAGFHGGTLSGKIDLELGGDGAFSSWLSLSNVELKEVLATEAVGSDSPATGKLHLDVQFPPGRYKGEKGLIGDGQARVEQGELGQLPLAASLFNALNLRSPLERSITRAEAKFGLTKEQIVFKELHLEGENRVLAGQGTVGFDGTLNLALASPKPESRGLWPLVDIPLSLVREQLVQVNVRGTAAKPEFQVIAVPQVSQLVDQFADALGLWRKRHPQKPGGAPPDGKQP
ncbi:MAG: hypothetical protein FJ291_27425 [Planctomycetes bacterium]|nr:hypothetical protein [Planctomycetota bacterium]